ncbi:hypothetical protein [Halobacteriovorax marinus]|nr:hypothetical protein [Halobacteriovorax marinus]
MKTIFSYLAKCFLTYTLTFALLQVQVLIPVQNLQHLSGVAYAANDRVSVDEDGVATKSGSVDLKNEKPNALLDHLAMISMGFFTFKAVSACQPRPMDVLLAAAGGAVYIGAELFSFNAFKDLKEKDKITYTSKENGENDTQIEMLEAQKKGYDDIAETAKTKAMIQMAAAAAYGAAAVFALVKSQEWFVSDSTCGVGCAQASIPALEGVKNFMAPSKGKSSALFKACTAVEAEAATKAANPATAAACAGAAAACGTTAALCATEVAICVPGAFSILGDAGSSTPDALEKFAKEGIKIPGVGQTLNDNYIAEVVKETELRKYQDRFAIPNFIEESSPFYELNNKLAFDETNFDTQINSYARNRDMSRYFQGELASTSVDSFNEFRNSMFELEVNSNNESTAESLKFALEKGVDLLIPSTHASSMTLMLGSAVAIFMGINKATSTWADTMIATPGYRSMLWTAAAGLSMVAFKGSKDIQESAEENSEKIQEIINKLNNQGQKKVDSLSGSQISIPSKIPFKIKGNKALSLGPEKVQCADKSGTSGCGSIKSGITKSSDFARLGGSFGAIAGAAGAAADDITGSDNISSAGVDGLVELSSNQPAVEKKLRSLQRKFNKVREESGAAPIDFDKVNKKILAKLRKNTQSVLNGSGQSASDVLAALGPVSKGTEEKEKKVAKDQPANEKLKMTAGKSKRASGGFKLDLENEGSNDGLNADEVLANQEAANAMNGEAQDDIVANKDVSIFKVISVRYLKSGFNKLLEEDK